MNILDVILGRTKPTEPKPDRLFAISTAQVTLQTSLGLAPGKRAAICFKPVESSRFQDLQKEIEDLLQISEKASGTKVSTLEDNYGFQWAIFEDDDFDNLVASVHMVSQSLQESGFGAQLLAAVFLFQDEDKKVYWIYNFKRGSFYPFVPEPDKKIRDNAFELRLSSIMEKEMPIEPEMERWYPMWNMPL